MGITPFGMFHTVLSLVAVVAGAVSLVRFGEISPKTAVGRTYIWMTVFACVTGLFIFHHGGFGKPHQLSIITLVVIGVALLAGKTSLFGRASAYVETLSYSLTFFFHVIPGFTETATRLPVGAPLVSGPDAPALQKAIGAAFVVFLIGAALQVRRLRASS